MKRRLILAVIACSTSLAFVQAQTDSNPTPTPTPAPEASASDNPGPGGHHGPHGPHGHGGMLEHLSQALSLSGTQQQQIAAILKQDKPQFEALHQQVQQERKAVIDSVATQINPILTPDQQAKFAEMQQHLENGPAMGPGAKRFAGGPGGKHGGPGAGDFLQKMTTDLALTQSQQTQIKPILDAAHTQIQSIRTNTSLTPEQKHAQIQEAWQGAQGQISGLLTADQQQKLAALRASMGHGHHHPNPSGATPTPTPTPPSGTGA